MSSLGPTFWEFLHNFFSWLASLFYEKERRPDCEEQIGLPTQTAHRETTPLDVASTMPKNRQDIQGRPPRHPDWARQNVFRHSSSKRKAVYTNVRPPRKRRPAPGPPLIQFDPAPQHLFHRAHTTPTIRIEDWSILPPSRKSLSHRLSFITAPTRALRLSSFITDTRQEFLSVPPTDSLGHLYIPYLSRGTSQSKHVVKKGSQQTDVPIPNSASPSDSCGSPANGCRRSDVIMPKVGDNKTRNFLNAGNLSVMKPPEAFRKAMPVSKKKHRFNSLPAAVLASLWRTNSQAEQDTCASNKLEKVGRESETLAINPVTSAVPHVSIDSTLTAKAHEIAEPRTTTMTVTHNSHSLSGPSVTTKLPYADFGDVPYPFIFDFDLYLSETDVPGTPLLLISFPGLGSEFSSPPTDYFDTPTPSPRLPVAPLLMQRNSLSDTTDIPCETIDSSMTNSDIVPERVIRKSLDISSVTMSLHSSVTEDISSSQSEYSIPSTDEINDSTISSNIGKPTGEDLDKLIFDHRDDSLHGIDLSAIQPLSSEARHSGESSGARLSEKVPIDVCSSLDEDGARMMNETLASLDYVSYSTTDKFRESGSEGESVTNTKSEDSQTIDESTFCNRHRQLLENLYSSVSKKTELQSRKKDTSIDKPILSEPANVDSVMVRFSGPGASSNNGAYSQPPRAADNVSITVESHFHTASQGDLVIDQRNMHYRPAGPFKSLTPMLIPSVGAGIRERMTRLRVNGLREGFERKRPSLIPVDQESDGPHGVESSQVARRKGTPAKL